MSYVLQFDVSGVTTDETQIDDATAFNVQWKAQNLGPDDTAEFRDHLVIRSVDDYPGDDDDEHSPVVYDSDTDRSMIRPTHRTTVGGQRSWPPHASAGGTLPRWVHPHLGHPRHGRAQPRHHLQLHRGGLRDLRG